jgi:hypothetical protein
LDRNPRLHETNRRGKSNRTKRCLIFLSLPRHRPEARSLAIRTPQKDARSHHCARHGDGGDFMPVLDELTVFPEEMAILPR